MQTVTEILIDYSTSMKGDRLKVCKRMLLEEILPAVEYSAKVGIKTFSASRTKVPSIVERQSLRVTNKKELTNTINNLDTPSGNTPIAAAIKSSLDTLTRYKEFKKKVILITDGEENCNGDYEAEAKRTITEKLDCEIHVIGLGLEKNAAEKAKKIAEIANGTFANLDISTYEEYDSELVSEVLDDFTKAVRPKPSDTAKKETDTEKKHEPPSMVTKADHPKKSSEKNGAETVALEENRPTLKPKKRDAGTELLEAITEELRSLKTEVQLLKNNKKEEESEVESYVEEEQEPQEILTADEDTTKADGEIIDRSEKYVFDVLKVEYGERVKWLNENQVNEQSHDFEVHDFDGRVAHYIRCIGVEETEKSFLITKNEWGLFLNQTKNYQIFLVSEARSEPTVTRIDNLLAWLLTGKVVPYSSQHRKLKPEEIILTVLEDKSSQD